LKLQRSPKRQINKIFFPVADHRGKQSAAPEGSVHAGVRGLELGLGGQRHPDGTRPAGRVSGGGALNGGVAALGPPPHLEVLRRARLRGTRPAARRRRPLPPEQVQPGRERPAAEQQGHSGH